MKKPDFKPYLDENLRLCLPYGKLIYFQRLLVFFGNKVTINPVCQLDYIQIGFSIPAADNFYDKILQFLEVKQEWE